MTFQAANQHHCQTKDKIKEHSALPLLSITSQKARRDYLWTNRRSMNSSLHIVLHVVFFASMKMSADAAGFHQSPIPASSKSHEPPASEGIFVSEYERGKQKPCSGSCCNDARSHRPFKR